MQFSAQKRSMDTVHRKGPKFVNHARAPSIFQNRLPRERRLVQKRFTLHFRCIFVLESPYVLVVPRILRHTMRTNTFIYTT